MSDIDKLRQIARAATQGEWSAELLNDFADATHINGPEFASANTFDSDDEAVQTRIHANALHIATFDPPTVLALLDEIHGLRERVSQYEQGIRDYLNVTDGLSTYECGCAAAGSFMDAEDVSEWEHASDRLTALLEQDER